MENKLKQKQIEEMAKVVCGGGHIDYERCGDCFGEEDGFCGCIGLVERLYNAGYRKIPENAVVMTGTETEERLEDLLIDFDEMSFYPATLMPNSEECAREWKRKLIYAIGQLRKETAEKIFDKLYTWLNLEEIEKYGFIHIQKFDFLRKFREICKEISEGKNGKT
jgi:hypothetical protein